MRGSLSTTMANFAHPIYLLLLLLLPPAVWLHRRRRGHGVTHPSLELFDGLPAGRALLAEYGGLGLRVASLLLIVLALAQPRWPDLRTRLDTEGVGVMLVVDVSGSMGERDFESAGELVSRLDAAKQVFRGFIEERPEDLVGLVTFATRPEATCPLTLNHATLLRMLDAEEARGVPGESETNLSDAVALGLARLRAAGPRRKVLVLLTDGEHNQSETRSGWTPRQAAQVAASLGVPVYAIDMGAEADPSDDAARGARGVAVATLQDVARVSAGRYFAARDVQALAAACRAIDRLERTKIASYQYRRYHEAYPWLALAAFVGFAAALALEQTFWRRLP